MLKPNRFFTLIASLAAVATPLWAQSARTWVASNGSDANNCLRNTPCGSFQGALAKTIDGGIINCVDADNYNAVQISTPVTIDCTGTGGTILANGNAITVNPPPNAPNFAVVIRGLEIGGTGVNSVNGIRLFDGGGALTVENVVIRNFVGGNGISFEPSLAARLHVVNSTIEGNGNPVSGLGHGIIVDPSGPGYAAVTLDDVRLIGNAASGLRVDVSGNTNSSTNVNATRSSFISSRIGIVVVGNSGTPGASALVSDSSISGNILDGVVSSGPLASISLSNSSISGNSNGVRSEAGGIVATYGDNRLTRNGTNGAFNGFVTGN